jgi:hypothetical protein
MAIGTSSVNQNNLNQSQSENDRKTTSTGQTLPNINIFPILPPNKTFVPPILPENQNSKLKTQNPKLKTQNSKPKTSNRFDGLR